MHCNRQTEAIQIVVSLLRYTDGLFLVAQYVVLPYDME